MVALLFVCLLESRSKPYSRRSDARNHLLAFATRFHAYSRCGVCSRSSRIRAAQTESLGARCELPCFARFAVFGVPRRAKVDPRQEDAVASSGVRLRHRVCRVYVAYETMCYIVCRIPRDCQLLAAVHRTVLTIFIAKHERQATPYVVVSEAHTLGLNSKSELAFWAACCGLATLAIDPSFSAARPLRALLSCPLVPLALHCDDARLPPIVAVVVLFSFRFFAFLTARGVPFACKTRSNAPEKQIRLQERTKLERE